jgi:transposase
LSGRIYKRHFDHAVHGPDVVVFLRHLQRYLPGPLMVIWDRLQAHRSAEVKVYRGQHPEIMVEELPTYAPDLNPEEGCHGDVKRHLLNATPEDTRQIKEQANRGSLMSGFRVVIPGGQRDRYNLPRGEAVHVLGPDLVVHRRGPGHARSHPEPHR